MAYRSDEEKTAVFTFGNLAYKGTEETYAPAFRSRETREETVKAASRPHVLLVVTVVLAVSLAVLLLVASLMGQARLTELNDQTVLAAQEIGELRKEQTELRISYEETFDLAEIEAYATGALGMQRPRSDQIDYVTNTVPDQVTVLKGEKGLKLSECWNAVIDTLGVCFH